jgi:four helix bundle protein
LRGRVAVGKGFIVSDSRLFRELVVWQKSMDLAVLVYTLVERFPDSERFAMSGQITRAAVSVPANIAEGNARGSKREFAQFIAIARGSLAEVETYILLAIRLGYVTEADAAHLLLRITEISKMLNSLRSRLLSPV